MTNPIKPRRGRGAKKDLSKVQTTVRLDADVLAFFKAQGPGYHTRINDELRKVAMKGLVTRLAKVQADRAAHRLAELGGSEPQLDAVPRRRTVPD